MSTTIVSKRKLRKELEQKLNTQIVSRSVYQERPYTCIVLEVKTPYGVVKGIGFSKVCYPDRWDAQRGEELAKDKAIAKIAKAVLRKMDADDPVVVRFDKIFG
jgi:hypothetical protein